MYEWTHNGVNLTTERHYNESTDADYYEVWLHAKSFDRLLAEAGDIEAVERKAKERLNQ